MATFTLCRGAQFVVFDEIDQSVAKLVDGQQEVKVQLLVVAGWYMSVSKYRISLRRHSRVLQWTGVCVRPTKLGIALRLSEWSRLKEVAKVLKEKFSAVADAQFDGPALSLSIRREQSPVASATRTVPGSLTFERMNFGLTTL
jgi:hypothetical protein